MKKLYLILICLILVSCGAKEETNEDEESNPPPSDGTYLTDCISNLVKMRAVYSGTELTRKNERYSSSCSTLMYIEEYKYTNINYDGSNQTWTNYSKGKGFTGKPKSQTITISDNSTVTTFNNAKVCGFTNWALDTPKDISGQECSTDFGSTTHPSNEGKIYGHYGLSDTDLYLPIYFNTSNYPSTLNSNTYKKQNDGQSETYEKNNFNAAGRSVSISILSDLSIWNSDISERTKR